VINTIRLLQVRLKTRKKKKARFLETKFWANIPRKRMMVSPNSSINITPKWKLTRAHPAVLYSSADSKGKTEKPPRTGRSKIEVIAVRGRAITPPLSPGTLSTSSRPHRSTGRRQSWDGSYLINARAESGVVLSNVPSELVSKASHASTN
jgi:hypothetical protein